MSSAQDHILCCVAGDPPKPSADAKYKISDGSDWDHMTGFTKLWHIKKGLPPYEEDEAPEVVLSTKDKIKFRVAEIFTGIKSTPAKYRLLFCPPTGEGEDERKTIGFVPTFISVRKSNLLARSS